MPSTVPSTMAPTASAPMIARRPGFRLMSAMPPWAMVLPRFHQHEMGREPQDLVEIMADVHHRDGQLIAQNLQVGQHFFAPRGIQRCQRFIQQQQSRLRQQGSTDRHALPFAPRQLVCAAIHQEPRSSRAATRSRLTNFGDPARLAA